MADPFASGGTPEASSVRTFNGDDGWIYYQPIGADGRPFGPAYTLGEPVKTSGSGTSSSTSTSFNTSQSFQDPAALQLQRDQLAQEQLLAQQKLAQDASQFNTQAQLQQQQQALAEQKLAEDIQLQWAQINQQIAQSNQTLALEQQNMVFLRDKLSIDVQSQNQQAQRETQALIEQITARMERTMTERAGLTQQAQMLQAQMQYQAQVENARNQIEADKTNEERRQFNLEQRRGVATDIANFAKDPGDVGANAAYLLAGGQAPISAAMAAGKDARTPQSLLPLGLLQGTQDELNRGPTLLNAPSVSAPNVPLPEFGVVAPPNVSGPTPIQMPTTQYPTIAPQPLPIRSPTPLAPSVLPPAKAAPAPIILSSGQAAPSYLSPFGDPQSPEAQARYNQGVAEDSIDEYTQQEDYAQHQSDLGQAGVQLAAAGDTNVEYWEQVAQEYQNRGYDIPGFAQGTPDFLNHHPPPGSNAPVSIVGEAGGTPEVLLNHQAIPGGPNKGFSIIPNHALPPQMGGQQQPPPGLLNALPQQASPTAQAQRPAGLPPQAPPQPPASPRGFLNVLPPQTAPQAQANYAARLERPRGRPQQMRATQIPQGLQRELPAQADPMALQWRGYGVPMFAEGTPDWASLMGGADPNATYQRSLDFLNSAFGQALGQSPWAGQGQGPNPVALSAPGTNPFIQEYAAALAATGSGIKPGLFQYEINQWKPQALSGQTVTRRTR